MNKTTAYIVLSVVEIDQLFQAAKKSRRVHKGNRNHCITLRGIKVEQLPGDTELQISSTDFDSEVRRIDREATEALAEQKNYNSDVI